VAVAAYRLSVQAGNPLSERRLAQMFGRTSRRWARARIAEARQASPLPDSRAPRSRLTRKQGQSGISVECDCDPAAYATDIEAARDRLVSFASGCADRDWRAAPLDGDPRPVAVVVDHVAHAYDYLAGWISQLLADQPAKVSSQTVDTLNAGHAQAAAAVTKDEAAEHPRHSGYAISRLVADLHAVDLTAGDGMVRRLAQIAARHADDHRADIQAALTTRGAGRVLYPAARNTSQHAEPVCPRRFARCAHREAELVRACVDAVRATKGSKYPTNAQPGYWLCHLGAGTACPWFSSLGNPSGRRTPVQGYQG
jgi:hypothetical protein